MENAIQKIQDMMERHDSESIDQFIQELKPILKSQLESVAVLSSSSNLLNFYVNDILDLALINNGKFRKNCSNFDVGDAI